MNIICFYAATCTRAHMLQEQPTIKEQVGIHYCWNLIWTTRSINSVFSWNELLCPKIFNLKLTMMGKKASVFLVSLLLLIGLSKQDAFDYFQVVHEWQPAICNLGNSCKIQPKNEFGIHGVWPSVYSKGQIGPCCGPSFDPLKVIIHPNIIKLSFHIFISVYVCVSIIF